MRIGPLRHRITIQAKTQGVDEYGGPIAESWADYAEVWASLYSKDGIEVFESQQVQSERKEIITIRYRNDITEEMRVMYEGKIYNIISVTTDNWRSYTVLTCKIQSFEQE